jgi:hypothetical protein
VEDVIPKFLKVSIVQMVDLWFSTVGQYTAGDTVLLVFVAGFIQILRTLGKPWKEHATARFSTKQG